MGVDLGPITPRQRLPLAGLRGRTLAVDAAIQLYQFLSILRLKDGSPLQDREGHVTSHLSGLLFRTVGLIAEHGVFCLLGVEGTRPERARRLQVEEKVGYQRHRHPGQQPRGAFEFLLRAGDEGKAFQLMRDRAALPDGFKRHNGLAVEFQRAAKVAMISLQMGEVALRQRDIKPGS